MNMISTGAFLNEMDASNKQPTVAEKFAAVWEKKNAKAARAGGVSLMALSLAACGSSSTTTTTTSTDTSTDTTTTPVASEFDLTPLTDIASKSQALNGSIQNDFRFTDGNDVVNGMSATIAVGDTLMDSSTTDNDVLNLTLTTASGQDKITTLNIETLNVNMAAASASFDAAAMTGVKNVNVSGVVDGALDDVAAAATIKLDGYTRALTINDTNYSGTATNKNADSANIEVSGTTYGSTAATQSKVVLTAGTGSTLETLNVASSGTAANDFDLDAGSNVTLSSVVVTGATAATIRMDEGDISGLTFDATAATGEVALMIDANGVSGATNALLFKGVNNLIMKDSTVGSDNANVTGVASGQKITLADDFSATTIAMASASYSSQAASVTIALDNETAATDTDISNITLENTSELNLISNGYATSTSTTAENSTGVLDGDFTTINISGDTSLAVTLGIDAKETATSTAARTVTVDASANTAFVSLDAQTDTQVDKVTYSLTGSAGNDTLKLNDTSGTLVGGAGNDSLYGGRGDDTINGGDGKDTVYSSHGTDTVTLGAGVDSIVLQSADVAAVAQVARIDVAATGDTDWTAGKTVTITLNDVAKIYTVTATDVAGDAAADVAAVEASLKDFINSEFGATVTAAIDTGVLTVTADTAGTAFTLTESTTETGNATVTINTGEAVANVKAIDTDVRVADFVTTSGGDVIKFDLDLLNGTAGIDNFLDSSGNIADTDDVAFINYTLGTALAANAIDAGANLVKVAYTSSINAASDLTGGMANGITLDAGSGSNTDALLTMYYDADDGEMVLGYMIDTDADAADTTTGEYDNTNNTFTELMQVTMTSSEYTALTASSFDII